MAVDSSVDFELLPSVKIVSSHAENNFNLIRLILAFLVIVSHSPEIIDGNRSREFLTGVFHTLSFGEVAVDGFFLLSGYLIVKSWTSAPFAWSFLQKRVLRIYPGFLVATCVAVVLVGPLGAESVSQYFASFWKGGMVKNILLLSPPVTPETFVGKPHPGVNNAMWTVHFEFICYFTVLAVGISYGFRRRKFFTIFLALCISAFAAKQLGALANLGISANGTDVSLIRFYAFFFTGAAYYIYRDKVRHSGLLALASLLALGCGMFIASLAEISLLVFGSYLMFYFAFYRIPGGASFASLPDASYGLYLYGWPAGRLLTWYVPEITPVSLIVLTTFAAYLCGLGSWYLIEKPALALKRRQRT